MKDAFQQNTIYLHEPLLIPKTLDTTFLLYVDTGMVELWPAVVRLCETENIILAEATEKIATLNPLHMDCGEWYQYKMRSLMRAHFLGNEVMTIPVEITHREGNISRYTFVESRQLGTMLLQMVQIA